MTSPTGRDRIPVLENRTPCDRGSTIISSGVVTEWTWAFGWIEWVPRTPPPRKHLVSVQNGFRRSRNIRLTRWMSLLSTHWKINARLRNRTLDGQLVRLNHSIPRRLSVRELRRRLFHRPSSSVKSRNFCGRREMETTSTGMFSDAPSRHSSSHQRSSWTRTPLASRNQRLLFA